jgi:hypothetical protein
MASEPSFSSHQNSVLMEQDTAQIELVTELRNPNGQDSLQRFDIAAPEPQHLVVSLTFFMIFSVCMLLIFFLGEQSAVYRFMYGEGGAHLISQSCTFALFCWGISVAFLRLKSIAYERSLLGLFNPKLITHHSDELDKSWLGLFTSEIFWGAQQVQGYLEGRAVLDEARARFIDRLELSMKGIKAAMWLIPLSGFLGTVIGMSLTIGRFDELFLQASGDNVKLLGLTDLAPAIQGLGTAFDTTLLALALVIPLKLALVYLEGRSEDLLEDAERHIAEPLLSMCIAQRSHSADPSQVGHELSRLDEQSITLNQTLKETSAYLLELRSSLMSHPALSKRAQEDLAQTLKGAIQSEYGERNDPRGDQITELLREIVEHQRTLGDRLIILQESVEAPVVLQRAPKHLRES